MFIIRVFDDINCFLRVLFTINKCSFNQIASTKIFRLIAEIVQHKITIPLLYWSLKMHFPHDYAIIGCSEIVSILFFSIQTLSVYILHTRVCDWLQCCFVFPYYWPENNFMLRFFSAYYAEPKFYHIIFTLMVVYR